MGFFPGKNGTTLYTGPLKRFCVPGMNCYSCPGALGACPIGSLQSVLSSRNRKFPFYVLGYLITVGVLVGRFICGWLCIFGLIEELLYKIPTPKLHIPEKIDRPLRYLKYLVLTVAVVGLPLIYRSDYGAGIPFFCEFLCPVGTLEGGITQVALNESLRPMLGGLYVWRIVLLAVCVLSSVFIYRPFCKYICPLGAFYSMFQKISLVRMKVDEKACVRCGACERACRMNVKPYMIPNSTECIRCGECMKACPTHAISFTAVGKEICLGKRKEKTGNKEKAR